MTKDKVLKLALEALELAGGNLCEALNHPKKLQHGIGQPCPAVAKYDIAITAIKETLAQPEQEPVACPYCHNSHTLGAVYFDQNCIGCVKRMTTPRQRTWVGLTPQERDEISKQVYGAVPYYVAFHHAMETKLKQKNGYSEENT